MAGMEAHTFSLATAIDGSRAFRESILTSTPARTVGRLMHLRCFTLCQENGNALTMPLEPLIGFAHIERFPMAVFNTMPPTLRDLILGTRFPWVARFWDYMRARAIVPGSRKRRVLSRSSTR